MTRLDPPSFSPIPNQLRAWAGTYKSHGRNEEFFLLRRAAELIQRGERDAEMAVELAAFSIVAEQKGQAGWASLLNTASEILSYPRS